MPREPMGAAMTHHKLLLTTAICGAAVIGLPASVNAAITTTTTTTHTYDFPGGTPSVSSSSSTANNCPPVYYDSGGSSSQSSFMGFDKYGHPTTYEYQHDAVASGGSGKQVDQSASYGYQGHQGSSLFGGGGGSSSGSSGSGSGSGSSKVLCTYFYHKDMLARKIWLADLKYARDFLKPETIRGYHAWAVPLVAYLQNGHHPVLEKIIFPIVNGWAHQMAYKVGLIDKPNVVGAILTATAEPLCYLIGLFAPARDYDKLWA